MVKVKGSLLLTAEELETTHIPEKERDAAVFGYYEMKSKAERYNDRFYALAAVYSHPFSYGAFYPDFVNMSWDEFKACESLHGISQTTFQMMQSFFKCPNMTTLEGWDNFLEKEDPRARTGYCNPSGTPEFVNNLASWEEWHRKWFVEHQEQIDWNGVENEWLPRPDLVRGILRRELIVHLGDEKADSIDDAHVVSSFYESVMKHKGPEIAAYASRIGGEVCSCNYYVREPELSRMEQLEVNSLREIYSILNRIGERQFISIDFKHGMFELLNEKGDHRGEARFDGTPNAEIETDHSLKCLDQWRKQTGR